VISARRPSLLGALISNALALSALYLGLGLVLELLRKNFSFRGVEVLISALDALPARILQMVGLLAPLRELYVYGRINEKVLRLAFGLTSVAVIFCVALTVGAFFGILRKLRS
jgi:hypothetical protein